MTMGVDSVYLDLTDGDETNSGGSAKQSLQYQIDRISEGRLRHDFYNGTSCKIGPQYQDGDDSGCCAAAWTCSNDGEGWRVHRQVYTNASKPGFIMAGTYGKVYAVYDGSQVAALKVPRGHGEYACWDILSEVNKMQQISAAMSKIEGNSTQCQATVMTLIDQKPCHVKRNGSHVPIAASYVMNLMAGDLHNYQSKFDPKCFHSIAQKAMLAIQCFHSAGWVHSDVKLPNFLWSGDDGSGCPGEVRLADYGMSGRIGSTHALYPGYYDDENNTFPANYLVSDVFVRPASKSQQTNCWKLNLEEKGSQYKYDIAIDWCSYHFLFPSVKGKYWQGDCGMMGPGRNYHVIVTK